MKIRIILFVIMQMIISFAVFGQERLEHPSPPPIDDDTLGVLIDAKFSVEQIDRLKAASLGAPAKVDKSYMDPKLQNQPHGEPAPWKVAPQKEPKEGRELAVSNQEVPANAIHLPEEEAGTQPIPVKPNKVFNYRNIKGPNIQEEAVKGGAVVDYRKMNGPDNQPAKSTPIK